MSETKYVYRIYKFSINFGYIYYYSSSSAHKLPKGPLPILIGILYSFFTLFLGFWWIFTFGLFIKRQGVMNSFNALRINYSGGEDATKEIIGSEHDERTTYVFRNLLRKTSNKVNIEEIEIILEIQDLYIENYNDKYTEENMVFIVHGLSKIDIHHITNEDLVDIFDAMKLYDELGDK